MAIFTERGRWANSTVDERGRKVLSNGLTERGNKVFGLNVQSGTTYSGGGTAQGQGSTSDTNTVILAGSGTAQGTGSTTSSDVTTQVYSGSGTAQGQGSTSDTNTYQAAGLYSGGGTAQGQASTTSSENVWKSGGGISSGSGSTTSSDSVWLAAGGTASGTSSTISADSIGQPTIYPGSGVAQGLASTESSEAYFKPGKIIQVKRGIERNLPSLAMGEFALTTDTGKLFIGTNQGNMQLATQVDINNLSQTITNLSIGSRLYTSTAMGWG